MKQVIAHSVTLPHPRDGYAICLFTDASESHWGIIVTQVPKEDLHFDVLVQSHEPLAFLSGTFSRSQKDWSAIEKQAVQYRWSCRKAAISSCARWRVSRIYRSQESDICFWSSFDRQWFQETDSWQATSIDQQALYFQICHWARSTWMKYMGWCTFKMEKKGHRDWVWKYCDGVKSLHLQMKSFLGHLWQT